MRFFQKTKLALLLIVFLGLFFRVYKLEIFYPWGHDQDLFAWIAKDIVINHHFRLIGQETSITGVFIGPIFYYLISLSFAIFNMNPLSAAVVTIIISLFTIFSIYWVFKKFFGQSVGILGSFLYAISPGAVFLDRWVVPTQPTMLWTIWFLYVLLSTLTGNFKIVIPLAILVGLIWHIHIAFIPLLVLLPVAFWLSGRKLQDLKFNLKSMSITILILVFFLAPFFAFELRHGFQQIKGIIRASYQKADNLEGTSRLGKVFESGGRSLAGAFVLSGPATNLDSGIATALPLLLFGAILYLWSIKILKKEQAVLFMVWFVIVFLGQYFSKRIITEYYFNNLFILLFLILALVLNKLNSLSKMVPVSLLMIIYLLTVTVWFIKRDDDQGGFFYKRKAFEYIQAHSASKNYPCVAINFIESKPGGGSGSRYLYWYYKLPVIAAGSYTAVYNIVNPWTISKDEVKVRFGSLGVIIPSQEKVDPSQCLKADRQLLPLWGFTN
ncbi:glycosyltransferase family 39 protein [Candidatus Daviesbacteria bacterium]|nr:glycosyltransferase family 39 protein [Candidatus Daviesbacteria bacterium]